MDPLTHTATGLFLSRIGLKRLTPLATPILLLAANAPDIDIVTTGGGSLEYLQYHRHLTHSLAAMPVMAILPVVLVRIVARKRVDWWGAFLCAFLAVVTHLALDYTNVYGVRLLLPFSPAWLRLDLTPIFDFWIWGALFLSVVGPFLGRMVASEITSGKTQQEHHGRGFAWFALAFLLIYNCGRGVLHARAVATLEAHLYEGETPVRTLAVPTVNPLQWHGVVETSTAVLVRDVDLLGAFDATRGPVYAKPESDPGTEAVKRTRPFQVFLNFSQFPLWRVTPIAEPENGERVEVVDMRFGTPTMPGFVATALVNGRGEVVSSAFGFGMPRPR
jgi:inner membrane protein